MKNWFLIILFCSLFSGAQNSVSGTFSPAGTYKFAFLYQANSNGASFVDRARLDQNGAFTIQLDSSLSPGIYKIVYAIPAEEHNFDFIYDGKESISFNFSNEDGVVFTNSNENKMWASYLKSMGMINQAISNYYEQGKIDPQGFEEIFKTLKDTQVAYETNAENMLVLQLIKANRPYIPSSYEDLSTYSKHLKRNYFKPIDFDNVFLQSSSFITERLNGYLFGMSENPSNDDYKSRIDDIALALKSASPKTQKELLTVLWSEFKQLENDELGVYISSKYLMPLATKLNDEALLNILNAFERVALGSKAPNFKLSDESSALDLYQLSGAKQYLLIFWSSGCSHCLKEVPMVYELLKSRTDIKVVAYGLEDNREQWEEAISNFKDFEHVYGAGKWDNPVVKQYSLSATPTYFLLDANKHIIAKPYDYPAVENLLKDQ